MDLGEVLNRAIKYLIEGIAVGLAAVLVTRKGIDFQEVVAIAIVAAAVFAVLDLVSPSIGVTARQGAGFGLGANLVGFPR
jgi:EamA domain-containing membrane protein RarD